MGPQFLREFVKFAKNPGCALQPVVFELPGAMRSGARSAGFQGVVDPGMSGD
jgi:hypothetical protein